MIHPLELFIGLRYTRAKRRNQFVSFISVMATLGIVLGVAAMITVLSVMNGFGKELKSRILGVVSHVTIQKNRSSLSEWEALRNDLRSKHGITTITPYINGQGMLVRSRNASGVAILGINPADETRSSSFRSQMIKGGLDALVSGADRIVIGKTLAEKLNLDVGSGVVLLQNQGSPERSVPRLIKMQVAGIFDVGMHQQNSGLVLIHLADAQKIFRMGGTVTGLKVQLDDAYRARFVSLELENELGDAFFVRDWMYSHRNFFVALEDQKRIMFIVLMLVVSVAAFNIVSTLVMMVTDKQSDIAILRTIGMKPASVMVIFIVQGLLVASIGIAVGTAAGILIASNSESIVHGIESLTSMNFLSADIYPITDLPSDIQLSDVIQIILASLGVSFLSTLYPAWRAARTRPAEALRYE